MPVPAPAGVILFFACPKKSIQKKRPPDAACFLRSSVLTGVGKRNIPIPLPTCGIPAAPLWAIPAKTSGTRRGRREQAVFVGWDELVNPNAYIGRCYVGVRTLPQPTS